MCVSLNLGIPSHQTSISRLLPHTYKATSTPHIYQAASLGYMTQA